MLRLPVRVECLGFIFLGLGPRVEGSGLRVEGLGSRVWGLWFEVLGVRVQGSGLGLYFGVWGLGFWI